MTSTLETSVGHPITTFASTLHAALDSLADVPAWSATADEQRTGLVELARARARLDELWLRLLAAGDRTDIAADSASTSTGAWLAAQTCRHPAAAQADVGLAMALDDDLAATRSAMARGDLDLDRARVVVAAVRDLPRDVIVEDPACSRRAEAALLEFARTHDARRLKQLGRHILHVLDPEAADRRLGERLEREERAAARATYLELHDNGDGTHGGRFRIPALHGAMLTKLLESIMNPARRSTGRPAPTDGSLRRSRPELRGRAFCELLERLPAHRVPTSGGVSATVVVLLDYDVLTSGLGIARLDTGERIFAGLARRLACEAGVIPAVVRRTAEDCDRPAGWCQAHHVVPWSAGGATSVANGRLLCSFHHHKAHSVGYAMEVIGTRVRFHRRT